MSSDAVIELGDVSKSYPAWAGHGRSLRDLVTRRHSRSARRWSLREVSLTVAAGESVGLIGGNGAGKSTLLRIASGLTQPSSGTVSTPRDTAAVLTLGEAFAPDLTGEENALTTAIVSGFSKARARQLLPEIIAYAELEDAAESPVRTYSEGMKLRLAFAVIAQLEPQALLLDEVMAVGDIAFQRKSAARIAQARAAGAAVLLATHDLERLTQECDRAIWLEHGAIRREGPADEVVAAYERAMMDETARRTPTAGDDEFELGHQRLGSQEARLENVALVSGAQRGRAISIAAGDSLEVAWELHADHELPMSPVVAIALLDAQGTTCASFTSERDGQRLQAGPGVRPMSLLLDRVDLVPGVYELEIGAYRDDWSYAYDLHSGVYGLTVTGAPGQSGVISPPRSWEAN